MSTEKDLWERIEKAIGEMIKPPVLTSPTWLRHFPEGRPADFQFMGTLKIAKATGKDVHRIAAKLLKQLDLESLGREAEVAADGVINIRKRRPGPKADSAAKAKPEKQPPQDSPKE